MSNNIHQSNHLKSVLAITIGMIVLYLITHSIWAIYTGFLIGFLGLSSSYLAERIDFLWLKLSGLLSKIIPNILLAIIFFFILTPIAILYRIFGNKNPLNLKNTEISLFKEYNKSFERESFEKTW
jgi:flagellar biosynthesis protein FlhB